MTYSGSSLIPILSAKFLINWLADDGIAAFSNFAGDNGVGLTIKQFPGISSSWLALMLESSGSYSLIATPDEYQTTYKASFELPASLYTTDACTKSSINSLTWNDIAFYENLLYLSTSGGLLRAQKSNAILTWSSVIQICIKKVKQHSQKPIDLSYWNPLIIIGNESSLYILSNQTATPIELLNNQQQTLQAALFSSSTSFLIIDSATTSLKKSILFLVLASPQYYLVIFDFELRIWKVVFRFPLSVPLYTSSSTNSYMRIWNTTSSNGAFDRITQLDTTAISLSLTGLQTSSNPSLGIFVLGNALFFSESFGTSMSLVHSLSNTTFNTFSSSVGGAFSIGTLDSRLWMGSLGASYLVQAIFSRTTSGLYHSFFDHSGKLNELAYFSNGLSRISYDFAAILLSGCPYSNLSFVYYPESSIFSTIPTSNNTVSSSYVSPTSRFLPDIIHLDYMEDYDFQIRVVPTDWSKADDLTLSFQLENSSLIHLVSSRSYDYHRRTIIYDVSIFLPKKLNS